jgi:hypothetical protein
MAPPNRYEYGNNRIGGDLFKYTCLSKFTWFMYKQASLMFFVELLRKQTIAAIYKCLMATAAGEISHEK